MPLGSYLHRVAAGADLTSAEAYDAMTLLLAGGASEAVVGAFLVALHVKRETPRGWHSLPGSRPV